MDLLSSWPALVRTLAACIPLVFVVAALRSSPTGPLRRASLAASLALGLALGAACGTAAVPSLPVDAYGIRIDVVTCVMLVLVCTIALVIARYSRSYLEGDPGQARYARWLLATLAAVTTLVLASHLLVVALAWSATSLALHQLLTFHRHRTAARVAAHKKFLVSRLADACLLGALVLIGSAAGGLDLGTIEAWAATRASLPGSVEVAMLLVVAAVSLKSAQLPFHGWLTQVMEAPTPVSALLHAGVVNIGGFVLIRLAPLVGLAPLAQGLLVVVGTATVVVAALVMTTRVSIKAALAWSTCAQMGFMLIECGLGAWHLALLHLVAHSLYKAHAFLSAGTTVDAWRVQSSLAPARPASLAHTWLAAALAVLGLGLALGGLGAALGTAAAEEPATALLVVLLGLSLAPMLARAAARGAGPVAWVAARGLGIGALYLAWHELFGHLLPASAGAPGALVWGVVLAGLVGLFAVQSALQASPEGRLAQALQPVLFAGLYLDELFTRATFRVWPPRLPEPGAARRTASVIGTLEVGS